MTQAGALANGFGNASATDSQARDGFLTRHGQALREGVRDGLPIALGYLAVSFSLGIAASNVGLDATQTFFASLFNNASAGEFAGFAVIGAGGSLVEMAVVMLIANARYLLMSCSMSQKLSPDTPLAHRVLIGFDLTDELFGIAIARPGSADPYYSYGAMLVALPGWALGGMMGAVAGGILPLRVVSALSVSLYGMFIAIIVPPARKNRVIAAFVLASFAASWAFGWLPVVSELSSSTRTIVLTVALSALAAALFPVKEESDNARAVESPLDGDAERDTALEATSAAAVAESLRKAAKDAA